MKDTQYELYRILQQGINFYELQEHGNAKYILEMASR